MLSFRRLIKSFQYALHGLSKTFREEQNFRVQSLIGIVAIALGVYFKLAALEWALLVIMIGLVLLMEIANSAVERIADVLKPRLDTYVKEIKDITAAGVLLASLVSLTVGAIIFLPKLVALF